MTPAAQLAKFLAAYTPELRAQGTAALAKLRALVPGAVEVVYDNYNALVIAFGAGERLRDIVLSIALYPRWVTLFFMRGRELPDPTHRLGGSGKGIRQLRLDSAATLDERDVHALIQSALAIATPPIDPRGKRRLVIKSVSPVQRSRVPTTATKPRPTRTTKTTKMKSTKTKTTKTTARRARAA